MALRHPHGRRGPRRARPHETPVRPGIRRRAAFGASARKDAALPREGPKTLPCRALAGRPGGARAATGEGEGVGPGNVMGLLSLMGRDCPEAVSFLGVGEDPVPRASDYVEVDEGVLGLRLSELMDRGEASWQARAEHWSLGGGSSRKSPSPASTDAGTPARATRPRPTSLSRESRAGPSSPWSST